MRSSPYKIARVQESVGTARRALKLPNLPCPRQSALHISAVRIISTAGYPSFAV